MASRRFARTDANQPEIVKALREHGFHVAHTHTIGKGFPDVVVLALLDLVVCWRF